MKYPIHPGHGGHPGTYPKFNTDDITYLIKQGIITKPGDLLLNDMHFLDGYNDICKICGNKYIAIIILMDGGEEPHFHIVDTETMGDKFDSAIKILSPEYYTHSNGDASDKLTKEMAEELNATLKKEWCDGWNLTKWSQGIKIFDKRFFTNKKYKKFNINMNTPQPDYTKLPTINTANKDG